MDSSYYNNNNSVQNITINIYFAAKEFGSMHSELQALSRGSSIAWNFAADVQLHLRGKTEPQLLFVVILCTFNMHTHYIEHSTVLLPIHVHI